MADFVLILVIIFLLFGVFRRYIFYAVMSALARKMFNQAGKQQQRYYQTRQNQQAPGSVRVEDRNSGKKKSRDDGEYVDFEEIKD